MFKTVKKNKFESAIIVSIFIIAVTLIIYYICNALNLGELSILIAFKFNDLFSLLLLKNTMINFFNKF